MKTRPNLLALSVVAVLLASTFAGCSPAGDTENPQTQQSDDGDPGNDPADDVPGEYEPDENVPQDDPGEEVPEPIVDGVLRIVFSGNSAQVQPASPEGITVERNGAGVTLTSTVENIEYVVSGTTSNGYLKIYSDNIFTLTLDGVSITNPSGPAINIQSGKHCFVKLSEGKHSTLADGATYATSTEDQKACFFSEGELIFSGDGSLGIEAKYKHAICSDDYVRIEGGTITITGAVSDGIHMNDSFTMTGGSLTSTSAGDGIDCEAGFIAIEQGTLAINTTGQKGHALKSFGNTTIGGGKHNLTVKGAASKGISTGGNAVVTGGTTSITTSGDAIVENSDTTSAAGIKTDMDFVMSGGKLTILSSGKGGKAISTDGDFRLLDGDIEATTTGGEFVSGSLDTSPKAIKADGDIYIKEGSCVVKTTSEGLEAEYNIVIDGGTVEITAADDAINASADRTATIVINGGRLYAYSSGNDAIDSNGTFTMTGGVVIASGTTQPEGGIDCDQNSFVVKGGTLISTGGATSYPTSGATQHSIVYNGTGASGSWVQLKKTDGEQVFVYRVPRAYGNSMVMLMSDASIVKGTGYTVTYGGTYTGGVETFHGYYTGGTYSGGTAVTGTTSSTAAYTTLGSGGGIIPGGPGRP